jgi:UDP-glucose 4-epimerase
MTDYFALPVIPAPLGFDARLQFVHEADAAACLVLATTSTDAVGNINVAGDGIITLMQAAALVGRPIFPVPLPAAGFLGGMVKRAGLADFSDDQVQYLAYGRGLDTTRMRAVLGFEPLHTTREAFLDFAPHVTAVVPGAASAVNAVQGAAGTAANALAQALGGRLG